MEKKRKERQQGSGQKLILDERLSQSLERIIKKDPLKTSTDIQILKSTAREFWGNIYPLSNPLS